MSGGWVAQMGGGVLDGAHCGGRLVGVASSHSFAVRFYMISGNLAGCYTLNVSTSRRSRFLWTGAHSETPPPYLSSDQSDDSIVNAHTPSIVWRENPQIEAHIGMDGVADSSNTAGLPNNHLFITRGVNLPVSHV